MAQTSPLLCYCYVGLALLSACVSLPETPETAPAPAQVQLQMQSVIPKEFHNQLDVEPAGDLAVPTVMLQLREVVRPRAEVRTGPGSAYELADVVLVQGKQVIETASHGVWRKVLVLGTWQHGWVHQQTLAVSQPRGNVVRVAMAQLPMVLVIRPVNVARGFTQKEPLAVSIPRGIQFRELRREAAASLVWLAQTNSAIWLSRRDVQ
ncbi:MAG: hypothetical protein NTZ90_04765 [Proteobacteria bacterium]|nr:hypothetical protein [Pseudomonadota bacterium]